MQNIRIQSFNTFEDIAKWKASKGDKVTFLVPKEARFVTLAEGIAIGRLHDLRTHDCEVTVKLTFPIQSGLSTDEVWKVLVSIPFLNGPFGLDLLLSATEVVDNVGTSVRDYLLSGFWSEIIRREGLIGDGKRLCVISREPSVPLPACLMERGQLDFPSPSKFTRLLESVATLLGGGQGLAFSTAEQGLSTFLYETARNSWEHGRETIDGTVEKGARGIVVEKLMVQNAKDLASRRDVPEFLRNYLERVHEARGKKAMFVIAVTVADYGRGIHKTLPSKADEDDWHRLLRAFQKGQSRKPKASDLNWGEGLPNIVDVCRPPLKGFLFVRSAELSGYADFSLPSKEIDLLNPMETLVSDSCGSSISVVWALAESGQTHDQQMLF